MLSHYLIHRAFLQNVLTREKLKQKLRSLKKISRLNQASRQAISNFFFLSPHHTKQPAAVNPLNAAGLVSQGAALVGGPGYISAGLPAPLGLTSGVVTPSTSGSTISLGHHDNFPGRGCETK